MPLPADLDHLDADALRRLLIERERELVWRQTKIERRTLRVSERLSVLTRLATQLFSRIDELLAHRW